MGGTALGREGVRGRTVFEAAGGGGCVAERERSRAVARGARVGMEGLDMMVSTGDIRFY